ncbi:MAG: FG-GAP-like repeat-containing protein [Pseudomonadota bacterium]
MKIRAVIYWTCVALAWASHVAQATPIVATPADNGALRPTINIAGASYLGLTLADIAAPPGAAFATSNIAIAQGVVLKAIPPPLEIPEPLFLSPNDDGDNDTCRFSYTNQRVTSRYKNLWFIPLEGNKTNPDRGGWGIFGEGPKTYHSSSDVVVRLYGLGEGEQNTGLIPGVPSSDLSRFATSDLGAGRHTVTWEAATQFSTILDVAFPFALNLYFNKIKYAPHVKTGAKVAKASAKNGAEAASKVAAKNSGSARILENAFQTLLEETALQLGGEISNTVNNARSSDPNGRFSIYDLMSVDSAVNRANQKLTIWDIHAPTVMDPDSGIKIQGQNVILEATDFGGVRWERVEDKLRNMFDPNDFCDSPLQVRPVAPPTLFTISENPQRQAWTIEDDGPYDHNYFRTRLDANQELYGGDRLRTNFVQNILVRDTQAPILLPPSGFARLSSEPIAVADLDLGEARVVDLADPNPSVSRTGVPVSQFEVDRRYLIEYTATDASGNSTQAPANEPEKYTQIVSVKSTNNPPSANSNSATTVTSQPVEIQLTASDPDVLDGRADPLAFEIVENPANGEFVAPLLPYFIEDFRLQPVDTPTGETYRTLACPANLADPNDLEASLALLSRSEHYNYLKKCYCRESQDIPIDMAYNTRYVHVTDKNVYFLLDDQWFCNQDDPDINRRISKWQDEVFIDQTIVASGGGGGGFIGDHLSVDESAELIGIQSNSGQPGEDSGTLSLYSFDLDFVDFFRLPSSEQQLDGDRIRATHLDSQRSVIYVTDGYYMAMYDYDTRERLGLMTDETGNQEFLQSCGGGTAGFDLDRGYHFQTDSTGAVYLSEHCSSRIHKFEPPTENRITNQLVPGDYIGWLGRCSTNLTDRNTGVPFNNCNEDTQTSYGYQCTDTTCARSGGVKGSAPGQLSTPAHINISPGDILYVADYDNLRVQRFGPDGTFAGEAVSEDDGIEASGNFILGNMGRPRNVSVNSSSFHVLEYTRSNNDSFFLHVFKTIPFYDVTDNTAKVEYVSRFNFYNDSDQFLYQVSDGIAESNVAQVDVQVNRAFREPDQLRADCYSDDTFTERTACDIQEDADLYIELSARDVDGFVGFGGLDSLTFNIVEAPESGALVRLSENVNQSRYKYTPDLHFFGTDAFSFTASDGVKTSTETGNTSIEISPVYDPPDLDLPASYTVGRGFRHDFAVDYEDVDQDPQKDFVLFELKWGNGDASGREVSEGENSEWQDHGLYDNYDDPIHPVVKLSAEQGKVMFAHTYEEKGTFPLDITYQGGAPGRPFRSVKRAQIFVEEVTQVTMETVTPQSDIDPGVPFDLTLRIKNEEPDGWSGMVANNVEFEVTLPQGITLLNQHGGCTPASSTRVLCRIGGLNPGSQADVFLRLQADLASAIDKGYYEFRTSLVDDGPRLTRETLNTAIVVVADDDGDGVINALDAFKDLADYSKDTDADGQPDAWEAANGLDLNNPNDAYEDPDGDRQSNIDEFLLGNSPLLAEQDTLLTFHRRLVNTINNNDMLGFVVDSGDVNRDGYSDVIIGAPRNNQIGSVFVAYGGPEGIGELNRVWQTRETSDFGRALAVADFDGNGYADIAVGEYSRAWLFMNDANGIDTQPISLNLGSAHFGAAMAAGDVDGDGNADLLIGDHGWDYGGLTNRGTVFVYVARNEFWENGAATYRIDGVRAGEALGRMIETGDLDGDSETDLLLGLPFSDSGEVRLYMGADNDWSRTPDTYRTISAPTQPDTRYGFSISADGDVDGDGTDDLLVGAYGATNNSGEAHLYLSRENYLDLADPQPYQTIQGNNPGDQFGVRVALLPDLSPYVNADAVIGANRSETAGNRDEGEFTAFRGHSNGLSPKSTFRGLNRQMLGYYVADAGDVDGDGRNDVIVGAPEIASGHNPDGGYAEVYLAGARSTERDEDEDGVGDANDNCGRHPNPNQSDRDGDGRGDVCDPDADGDGLPKDWEEAYGLDDLNPDDAMGDRDGDGVVNLKEYKVGTDPTKRDTDGDSLTDAEELRLGLAPLDGQDCPENLCPQPNLLRSLLLNEAVK